jgi:glycosyltransferase involved in cell wall biosynthesis
MKISVFLLCYNEEILIDKAIRYYREKFPSCTIIIVDNKSDDRSIGIALSNKCELISFDTQGHQNEAILLRMRNNVWRIAESGWVIMADMDEWLVMTEKELEDEDQKGTTIITTKGFNIVGDSKTTTLDDVNIFEWKEGVYDEAFSKRVLFKIPDVDICYSWGAHTCNPIGNIKYSKKEYILKHMNWLGKEYTINKYKNRYERNKVLHNDGSFNAHYFLKREEIEQRYDNLYLNKVNYEEK